MLKYVWPGSWSKAKSEEDADPSVGLKVLSDGENATIELVKLH